MAVTPNTDIRLLKTPFEIDNQNQLTFSSVSAQTTYFLTLPHLEEDNCSYQRRDNVIRFPAHIDSILDYNYVMYKNENYTNKWFYAFITNMEYLNDNVTLISIETDCFQTWQFDIVYKKMFVEREHVNDDTIGKHTIPENLNVGEVIEETEIEDTSYQNLFGYWIGIYSDWDIPDSSSSGGQQYSGITIYNNVVSGNKLYLIKIVDITSYKDLLCFILRTHSDGHVEDIKDIFIIPNVRCASSFNNSAYSKYI